MVELTDSMKREIGQHFVFGFHGHELSEEIKTLIKDYHIGSVILMKRNVKDAKQVRRIVCELQSLAKTSGHVHPLLVGIDQESGLVSAFTSPSAGTQFPGAMALAAAHDIELAFQVSAATAEELKLVGINWVYSPVADVNFDSKNPVIGVRSFGDSPQEVSRYATAVVRGHASSGVASSAKHFPGHGDTHIDSHLALPVIAKSKDELKTTDLVPFEALIRSANPVPSVMIGHMALPGLTGGTTPASLSHVIITELLRDEMGYEGVVVTDCLEMDAIAEPLQGGCGVEEGAVRYLASGVDIVMICHTFERHIASVKRVYEAIGNGHLEWSKLQNGKRRVERMKEMFVGSWDDVLGVESGEALFEDTWRLLKLRNSELSKTAYQRSSAVVWGADKLPLKVQRGKEVLLFTPTMESLNRAVDDAEIVLRDRAGRLRNMAGASYLALASEVQARARIRHVIYSPTDVEIGVISHEVDAVIFVLRNADRSSWQKQHMRKLLGVWGGTVVLVSSCGPYDMLGESELRDSTAWIASFEFTPEAFEAVAGIIFDGVEGTGRVPVRI